MMASGCRLPGNGLLGYRLESGVCARVDLNVPVLTVLDWLRSNVPFVGDGEHE